jgi:ABC-type transport system substrate-binding protein
VCRYADLFGRPARSRVADVPDWLDSGLPDPENFLDVLFYSQSDENHTGYNNSAVDALLEAGQTKILLYLSDKRSEEYPDTPILKDLGYDISVPVMLNVAGPKDLPEEIVKRLEDAFTKPGTICGLKHG